MTNKKKGLKTIWYFVGLVLMSMGVLVFISGVIQFISPTKNGSVLSELHPSLWWGALMIVIGLIYYLTNKNKIVE
jgi:uncharacterized membrane protein HdeD (DUF308 family)